MGCLYPKAQARSRDGSVDELDESTCLTITKSRILFCTHISKVRHDYAWMHHPYLPHTCLPTHILKGSMSRLWPWPWHFSLTLFPTITACAFYTYQWVRTLAVTTKTLALTAIRLWSSTDNGLLLLPVHYQCYCAYCSLGKEKLISAASKKRVSQGECYSQIYVPTPHMKLELRQESSLWREAKEYMSFALWSLALSDWHHPCKPCSKCLSTWEFKHCREKKACQKSYQSWQIETQEAQLSSKFRFMNVLM